MGREHLAIVDWVGKSIGFDWELIRIFGAIGYVGTTHTERSERLSLAKLLTL